MKGQEQNQKMDTEMAGVELAARGGNYSPVKVINNDTLGTLLLGIMAIILLIAFMRSQARNRLLESALGNRVS